MTDNTIAIAMAALALTACNPTTDKPAQKPSSGTATSAAASATKSPPAHIGDAPPPTPQIDPAARRITIEEWRKADNFDHCAPLALKSDAGAQGKPRRANFAGGWAVAFDQAKRHSAYGYAGSGDLDSDKDSAGERRARLARQWPVFRDLDQFPAPSFAGYGVEGASPFPADNPVGNGLNSLAYVYIAGQTCMYNVWSRLGRAHLEHLLDNLELIDPNPPARP